MSCSFVENEIAVMDKEQHFVLEAPSSLRRLKLSQYSEKRVRASWNLTATKGSVMDHDELWVLYNYNRTRE